jgi:hypothetical protein
MYFRTQTQLIAEVKARLNNRAAVTFPWTDTEVRQSIQQAVGMCFPVGTQAVVTMAKADYDANPQKYSLDGAASAVPAAPALLHIRQVEVRNTAGQPTFLERGIHYQVSPHGAQFIYLFQPMATGDSLRLDAVLGVAEPNADPTGSTDDATTIKLDSTMLIAYACAILLLMNSRTGTVSSRQDDALLSQTFMAQAESRKAFIFQQQYGATMEFEAAGSDRKR